MKSDVSTRVVVDRIEGDLAVLVLYDDDRIKFNLPLRYLPEAVREGDHLRMVFVVDEAGRESEGSKIEDLLKQLKRE